MCRHGRREWRGCTRSLGASKRWGTAGLTSGFVREHRDILELFDALPPGEVAVLATVVEVRGSAYRRPGARLLLVRDGRRAGSISGGCLESDLHRRAWGLTQSGPKLVAYDTRGDDERPAGEFNTGCDGIIRVLIERVIAGESHPALVALRDAQASETPIALATVCEAPDDAGFTIGARLRAGQPPRGLGFPAGEISCALSRFERNAKPTLQSIEIESGEMVAIFLEQLRPPRPVIVFGAGDDAATFADLAATLGWSTIVVARRPGAFEGRRFANARQTLTAAPLDALRRLRITPETAIVLMTHRYDDDLALVPALLASPAFYIAMLGPKARTARLVRDLSLRGELPGADAFDRLHAPAGLDIGGDGAAAVALSVLAEIESAANARDGGPLRDRRGPIHDATSTSLVEVSP